MRFHLDKNALSDRAKGFAAAIILAVGLAVVVAAAWLGCTTPWMNTVGFVLLGVGFLSIILVAVLSPYENKGGFGGAMYKAAYWNFQVWGLLLSLLIPAILLVIGLLVIVLLPFSVVYGLLKLVSGVVAIKQQTVLFVSLSLGGIISAHYSTPLFGWMSKLLTRNGHRYELHFKRVIEYVYKPTNIQFVVFLLYVLFLFVSTIYRFQMDGKSMWENEMDLVVLESFLVFVAFSNMKTRREKTAFKFSELFKIIYAMWTTHDSTEEEK